MEHRSLTPDERKQKEDAEKLGKRRRNSPARASSPRRVACKFFNVDTQKGCKEGAKCANYHNDKSGKDSRYRAPSPKR